MQNAHAHVDPGAEVADDVSIAPGAVIHAGAQIGARATIGVAAGALVTRDVADRDVVMGVPARVVRRVGDEDLLERWR